MRAKLSSVSFIISSTSAKILISSVIGQIVVLALRVYALVTHCLCRRGLEIYSAHVYVPHVYVCFDIVDGGGCTPPWPRLDKKPLAWLVELVFLSKYK